MPIHGSRASVVKAPTDGAQFSVIGLARGTCGIRSRIVTGAAATFLILLLPQSHEGCRIAFRAGLRVRADAQQDGREYDDDRFHLLTLSVSPPTFSQAGINQVQPRSSIDQTCADHIGATFLPSSPSAPRPTRVMRGVEWMTPQGKKVMI